MRRKIDILGEKFIHPIYGEYTVISQEESKNKACYFKIRFKNTGYETVAKSANIRNLQVKDKLYYKTDILGKRFTNNVGQVYEVISKDENLSGNFVIEFLETHTKISRRRNNIIEGRVLDPKGATPSTIFDKSKNKKIIRRSYTLYKAMVSREKLRGSIVCDEWKNNYNNFVNWLENTELPKHNVSLYEFETYQKLCNYDLDKDYIDPDNILYSPGTCCLIPHDFNMTLRNLDNCNFVLSKDGQNIEITNLRKYFNSLGYKIKLPSQKKRKRRLQRSISRKYEKNKKGGSYCKTSNIIKRENKLLKLNYILTNIRKNYLNQTTSEIVNRKPRFICIEDLNVSGMMKNKHLSKVVQQQGFYEFRRQIEYKSEWNNIPVIIADRFFPSSKLCSCCGSIKKDLKLSDRIYKCECGNVIDRDFQAALNLKRYGENVLKESVA